MALLVTERRGRLLAAGLLVMSCAMLSLGGCKQTAETPPTPEVLVEAVHPQTGAISSEIAADATLAPLAEAALTPKLTAPVRKFYVQRGSKVKAGQLLATLENADLAAAALDNRGTYTAAQAAYETATKATVPEDFQKTQLDLTQAKAALDLNRSIVTARTQLFGQGAIPGRDLDTAKAALGQAQAAYEIARQHLQSAQQVGRKASLENAQGQLASAKGKYLGAEAQLRYTEIRSPINGVVTDRPLFAGETAAAGAPVITVMDTSALLAKMHLSQLQAQQLKLGGEAEITIPGMDEPVKAKVSLISPALDPGSTTVEVWLRVENASGTLKAGTSAHAALTGRTVQNALLIPASAVQTVNDGPSGGQNDKSVMVIAEDGTARKRTVTLGIKTAEQVQVLTGLIPADRVITVGGYGIAEGTKVKVGAEKADAGDAGKPSAAKKDD